MVASLLKLLKHCELNTALSIINIIISMMLWSVLCIIKSNSDVTYKLEEAKNKCHQLQEAFLYFTCGNHPSV